MQKNKTPYWVKNIGRPYRFYRPPKKEDSTFLVDWRSR